MIRIFTYDPKKNKKVYVGKYDKGTSTFFKTVSSRHYMIKEQGYGVQEDIIQQLRELDCQIISIDSKTGSHKFVFSTILDKPIKNYGHGEQRFLSVSK